VSDVCLTFNKDEILHVRVVDDYISAYVVSLLSHKIDV